MTVPTTAEGAPIASTELELIVTLTVMPQLDQSLEEAAEKMEGLFTDYVTGTDNWLDDYGLSSDEIAEYLADPEESPRMDGFEGPFCLKASVRKAAAPVTQGAAYHREMGDTYARIALESNVPAAKTANAAEAAKYYGIAERLEAAERSSQ